MLAIFRLLLSVAALFVPVNKGQRPVSHILFQKLIFQDLTPLLVLLFLYPLFIIFAKGIWATDRQDLNLSL